MKTPVDTAEETGANVRAWPLLGAAAAIAILALCGVVPVHPGIVHAVALPPFDLTYDLGILLGRATTPAWFAAGLLLAVVGRATVLALMLGSLRSWWLFALRFELLCLLPAFAAAELAYSGQTLLYAALFWVGIAVAVVSALAFAHIPWRRHRSILEELGRGLLHGTRVAVVILYTFALIVLGAISRPVGTATQLIALFASALLTVGTARILARPTRSPAASAVAACTALVLLASAGLYVAGPSISVPGEAQHGELVLVPGADTSSGHGTLFTLPPGRLGFSCARTVYFSYAGPGSGAPRGQAACPVTGAPYTRAETERPLRSLIAGFRAQVDRLPPPVTVVTHSSGAWIAWASVAGDPTSPVRRIIMLSPLTRPHGYPRSGTVGAGVVGAAGMRLVSEIGKWSGFSKFDPDRPFAREMLGSPTRVASILARGLPGRTRGLAVISAYDLSLFTDSTAAAFPGVQSACPLLESHSGLVDSAPAIAQARRFLDAEPPAWCSPVAAWIADSAGGFAVP